METPTINFKGVKNWYTTKCMYYFLGTEVITAETSRLKIKRHHKTRIFLLLSSCHPFEKGNHRKGKRRRKMLRESIQSKMDSKKNLSTKE